MNDKHRDHGPKGCPRQPRIVHPRHFCHRRGEWFSDPARGALLWIAPGVYEEAVEVEPTLILPRDAIESLIEFLNNNGYLRPRLDDALHKDDMAIINRLFGLVETVVHRPPTPLPFQQLGKLPEEF